MKKWIFATLMTAAMFATHAGSGNAQPSTSNQDETGTCSYTCSGNGRTYVNRAQCTSACAGIGVCQVEAC